MSERREGDQVERGRISVANLRHPGGCDVAPRALVNLMEAAAAQLKLRVDLHPATIGLTDPALFDHPMVFMHGRNSFHLTDAERAALRTYVDRGGVVLADAICASRAFADSFRREMAAAFPDLRWNGSRRAIRCFRPSYGGFDLARFPAAIPSREGTNSPLSVRLSRVPPELEGIRLHDRYGVIFSQFDLSCALEKRDSLECRGYAREDAARIALNVLLYSLH